MAYTVEEDNFLKNVHGYTVYCYSCSACGEKVDCNGRFDRKPQVNFCHYCGEELSHEVTQNPT